MTERAYVAVLRHTQLRWSEPFVADQARALGVPALLVARDPVPAAVVEGAGLPVVAFAPDRWAAARYTVLRDTSALRRVVARSGAQVLHAHFGVEGSYALPVARALGIPGVTTLHGFDVTLSRSRLLRSRSPAWWWYGAGRRRFLAGADALICVSRHIAARAEALGADASRLHVIGTGVDTTRLEPTPVPAEPVVVHVARLVEKKGTAALVDAFARVRRQVPGASLRVVGDGPLRARLEGRVDALGLGAAVTFVGAVDHRSALDEIRSARVLCLPSVSARSGDEEGLGQVLLEAAALGRPVVATDNGGMVDAVVDGRSGLVVAQRAVDELAEALVEVLTDDRRAAALGAGGRELVVDRFDVTTQARKVADLYRALVGGTGQSGTGER